MGRGCIILANGRPPEIEVLRYFMATGFDSLICADGGANSAKMLGVVPDFIVGDLDSIEPATLEYFGGTSKVVKYKRQNDTDVEKCIKFAAKSKFTKCLIMGVTGDRLDHSFCNIGITIKFMELIDIFLVSGESILEPFTGTIERECTVGETVSIYGITRDTLFTTTGLKYRLKSEPLPFGVRESTSNIVISKKIKVSASTGAGLFIRSLQSVKENGFFTEH
mgnify:FL=1